MCGIVAIIVGQESADDLDQRVRQMTRTLVHRGPDDEGFEVDSRAGVALGMRRLSILDLAFGHQPMWDERRQHCVVFNGEIYNAAELRDLLVKSGHRFASDHSDTEVLVHGYEEWGEDLPRRLNGMFAYVIWDRPNNRLALARDRAGEKPLYVGRITGGFAVASELKALMSHPSLDRTIDVVALEQYLSFDYALTPRSILKSVRKVPSGHTGTVTFDSFSTVPYWTLRFDTSRKELNEQLNTLDKLLDAAVARRMIADVPIGLFLSGGLDSSSVGYYMHRHSSNVQAFSIGFEEPRFDESLYAAQVARHLGLEHHLEIFSQAKILELVPKIPELLDEPMGDPSVFPTLLLCAYTRRSVKVALGGDGSDELLMGYRTYQALKILRAADKLPRSLKQLAFAVGDRMPNQIGGLRVRGKDLLRHLQTPSPERLFEMLGSFSGDGRSVLSPSTRAGLDGELLGEWRERVGALATSTRTSAESEIIAYFYGYLQDDILVKVDRASMSVSLEVRAPFLDPEVIDFLGTVSPNRKLRGLTRKYMLRQLMRDRLPAHIIDRPKQGFGMPVSAWLRESLAPLLHHFLAADRLQAEDIFDTTVVHRLLKEHLSRRADHGNKLWLLLQFQLWRDRWLHTGA